MAWLLASGTATVASAEVTYGPVFAVIEENDLLANPFNDHHPDRHYTQGLRFVYLCEENQLTNALTGALEHLPALGYRPSVTRLGFLLGQSIYTPKDLSSEELIPDDRPYAGWLYVGLIGQRRGSAEDRWPTLENFELHLGVVGPESLAQAAQETIHRWWYPDYFPYGWHHQLDTEPGLLLKYGRVWRCGSTVPEAGGIEFLPHVGGQLGNIQVSAAAGATLRAGWHLPDDFGVQLQESPLSLQGGVTGATPAFGWYVFGRVEGRLVGHNLFLDGNTFQDSHRVDKEYLVADLSWGIVLRLWRHFELTYTRVMRTDEFRGQDGPDYFGSMTGRLSFTF